MTASPAASPAHQPAAKKDKKKKPKTEEAPKDAEPTKPTEALKEPVVVEPAKIVPVEEEKKIVEKVPEAKKEKNNNKPKPVEVAAPAPVSVPEAESEGLLVFCNCCFVGSCFEIGCLLF